MRARRVREIRAPGRERDPVTRRQPGRFQRGDGGVPPHDVGEHHGLRHRSCVDPKPSVPRCARHVEDRPLLIRQTVMTPSIRRQRPKNVHRERGQALWSAGSSYTATVTKRRDRERDIVRELQEDANWSMWTNTFGRQRGWGRPRSLPHGVGLRTYMLAAVIIFGTAVAVIGLIALLLSLD
jgi:hypothetical protein